MTADRSTPVRALLPDRALSTDRPSAAASGFADLLGGARAATSRPGAYAASSRPQRAAAAQDAPELAPAPAPMPTRDADPAPADPAAPAAAVAPAEAAPAVAPSFVLTIAPSAQAPVVP